MYFSSFHYSFIIVFCTVGNNYVFLLFHYSLIIVFCTVGNDYVFFIISLFIHYWLSLKKLYSTLLNSTQIYSTIHIIRITYYILHTTYHILRTMYQVPRTTYHLLRTTYYKGNFWLKLPKLVSSTQHVVHGTQHMVRSK